VPQPQEMTLRANTELNRLQRRQRLKKNVTVEKGESALARRGKERLPVGGVDAGTAGGQNNANRQKKKGMG